MRARPDSSLFERSQLSTDLDLDRVKTALRSPVIIDLRNIYRPAEVAAKGLTYVSVGSG